MNSWQFRQAGAVACSLCRLLGLVIVLLLPSVYARADEPTIRTGVSGKEIAEYLESLSRNGGIVTDLAVQLENGRTVYEVTSVKNQDSRPWVILVNISELEFRKNAQQYADDGFAMPIHREITVDRKKFHSAVWVQDPSAEPSLFLPAEKLPESGSIGSDLDPLRDVMTKLITENNIPGGTLAVAHKGKMIFERGFGYSDIETKTGMPAAANMRIASLSKPITAVAILILVQEGKLDLDGKLIDLLASHPKHRFETKQTMVVDPRWSNITVRNLLQHSGGWDRDKSKDTVFQLAEITKALELKRLARTPDMIRYQFRQPLDFDPGSQYAYSNIGYCMLGRVIESASGQTYDDFVRDRILKPAGMTQTRLGKTRLTDRAIDEVHYYTQKIRKGPAIWNVAEGKSNGKQKMVPSPYGQWDLEVMDAHGGWTSTAPDLVRFIDAIDEVKSPLLNSESIQFMLALPSFADSSTTNLWYGLGWNVRVVDSSGGKNFWHTGSLAGTSTLMVRRWDGYSWAVLFNVDQTKGGERCTDIIDREIHQAVNKLPIEKR